MGLFRRHRSYTNPVSSGNGPNPNNFKILKSKSYASCWVSWINYPDAKNYEGNKILLTTWDPNTKNTVDPHFDRGAGIIARFEPTDEGWELAKKFAKLYLNSAY